ncbi:PDZ domain-containing protein [Jatrophihabitans endophyticus]|uniref:YlbL family protein n=1 Tax=Jatrophihabitans endophyticus TaxID=1206085 RepID=UPI0019E19485|nr:S16 family serine protease [Jatrophihabitans endophyticus]MBE7188387.1 PDZ domain-containing protein [Jatrophihabitans endophyticus]
MPRLPLPSVDRVPGGTAFAGLSRRVRTLIVAGVLFLVLFVLALLMPVPYVILTPGPTYNTLGRAYGSSVITIDGRSAKATTGHLNLTTVSVTTQSVSAFQAFVGWLAHDQVVVPRSAVYPPNQTTKQTNEQNIQDFIQAQDSATNAALCQLHYPQGVSVVQTVKGEGSAGKLQPHDRFVSVAGRPTTTVSQLTKVLATQTPKTTVPVVVLRSGKDVTEHITLGAPNKGKQGASLGVGLETGCFAPFTVDLGLANRIGGPSAGLMFALGIMDKVGDTDLTKGMFIAGTGTIDSSGGVGAIGGIALKMIAARDKGASVFLAPAGNCSDVRGAIPSGLDVVKVSTLKGAVHDLLALQQHKSVPHC